MVVALLSMLFVVGVAFLQSVTFEGRQIAAEVERAQEQAALDTIEAKLFQALNDHWLGPDGTPYRTTRMTLFECVEYVDPDDPNQGCVDFNDNDMADRDEVNLALPVYGELPFVHGLMAPLEPYLADFETPAKPVLPYGGDIGPVAEGKVATLRDYDYEPNDPTDPDEYGERRARINLNDLPPFAVDADGDGVPDSREFDLTTNGSPIVIPPAAREMLLERLNDPDAGTNRLLLSVRMVPHGGMVDLNWAHPELVYAVFPDEAADLRQYGIGGPYPPEVEEATLRNRGGSLPPRRMATSALQERSVFEHALFGPHATDPGENDGTRGEYRWWFHDLSEGTNTPFWFDMMMVRSTTGPSDFSGYDRRHVVTTLSTDDLFLRDGTSVSADASSNGRGWIEVILEDEDDPSDPADFGQWALDNYPIMLGDDDPRKGRMQISLPTLEATLLDDPHSDPVNNGVNSLQARLASSEDKKRRKAGLFVRTIQDAFLLMLRNVDSATTAMDDTQKARAAASLTANLIDFADSDNLPTHVDIIDTHGRPTGQFVAGLERQPFITEVYNWVVYTGCTPPPLCQPDLSQSFSAVELYNPYDTTLDLTPFSLVVDGGNPIALSGTITGKDYSVFVSSQVGASAVSGATVLSGMGLFTSVSDVELVRADSAGTQVITDRFGIGTWSSSFPGSDSTGQPGDTAGGAVERAMWRVETNPPTAYWTAVVPVAKDASTHTLGLVNSWRGDDVYPPPATGLSGKQLIRPVQVDFANSNNGLWHAFPTTGTLLLLMRYANSDTTPFTFYLAEDHGTHNPGEEWMSNAYQIDNGRMPLFDVAGKHRIVQGGSYELDFGLPMGYQFLPWGQYVFDYFTALPLDNALGGDENTNFTPEVQLAGARVYGRVNLNAAPWTVLAGLPLTKSGLLPASYRDVIHMFIYGAVGQLEELPLGERAAKAIVAYRDAWRIPGAPAHPNVEETGDFRGRGPSSNPNLLTFPPAQDMHGAHIAPWYGQLRKGSGFLTVGELANVRHWSVGVVDNGTNIHGDEFTYWRMDSGVIGRRYPDDQFTPSGLADYPCEDYVQAVGLLVALQDWVTTRSNIWTIYGTVRGYPGRNNEYRAEVEKRAIRFEETVDRLPSFLEPGSAPRRIGERRVGAYNDTRGN